MTSVTFPTSLGGSGVTISDDADPNTGLLNGGHRERFVPGLQGVVDMANYVYQYAAKIDGAAENATKSEEARAYVEGYAGALRSNLQAIYRQEAIIALDFAKGRMLHDTGIEVLETTDIGSHATFTRASKKLVVGPTGKVVEIAENTLSRRWGDDGRPRGVVLEESRTNIVTNNVTFSGWYRSDVSFESVAGAAPDGGAVTKFVESATYGTHNATLGLTVENAQLYSISFWAKSAGRSRVGVITFGDSLEEQVFMLIDLTTSEVVKDGGVTRVHVERYANGWCHVRASLAGNTIAAAALSLRFYTQQGGSTSPTNQYTGDGVSGVYIWAPQLERGLFSTSTILTGGSPVTRAADRLYLLAPELADCWAMTLFIEYEDDRVYEHDDQIWSPLKLSDSNETRFRGFGLSYNPAGSGSVQLSLSLRDGTLMESVDVPASAPRLGINRAAFSVDLAHKTIAVAVNGQSSMTEFVGEFNRDFFSTLFISESDSGRLSGGDGRSSRYVSVSDTFVVPRALTVAELEELTA